MTRADSQHWEHMYRRPATAIPWEIEEPPVELVDIVKKRRLPPCRALDVGCGTGNYALYLARHGFDVTGIDCSSVAIDCARERAAKEGIAIQWLTGDMLNPQLTLKGPYGFILDYSILHHIPLEHTDAYARTLIDALAPDGLLLSVSYTDEHERAQGDATAKGTAGNTMYFRTATQIAAAFASLTLVSHRPGRLGKQGKHPAHVFLWRKECQEDTTMTTDPTAK